MSNNDRNIISERELAVLSSLRRRRRIEEPEPAQDTIELSEICFSTGIKDSDEVLRALYTLEGKNLVQPEPPGDFTSSQWQITAGGMTALRLLGQ